MRDVVCTSPGVEKNLVLETTGFMHDSEPRTFMIIEKLADSGTLAELERFSLTIDRINSLIECLEKHKSELLKNR